MFEPWVRELNVRTRGLGNSMLEPRVLVLPLPPGSSNPWVRELYVRTRPGFGELSLCWNPGVWNSSPPPREFEPWLRELHVPSNFKE